MGLTESGQKRRSLNPRHEMKQHHGCYRFQSSLHHDHFLFILAYHAHTWVTNHGIMFTTFQVRDLMAHVGSDAVWLTHTNGEERHSLGECLHASELLHELAARHGMSRGLRVVWSCVQKERCAVHHGDIGCAFRRSN